jgi:hypothetical protein
VNISFDFKRTNFIAFLFSRFIDDRTKNKAQDADEHKQASEFRWPRDTLLSVISTFVHFSTQRLKELIKLINDPTLRIPELLDAKSHTRLADIAHTLLKLGGYDPITMSCRGIQNYFQKLLPWTNWSQEQLRPALNLLLRRIDRMFSKICKKPMTKVTMKIILEDIFDVYMFFSVVLIGKQQLAF